MQPHSKTASPLRTLTLLPLKRGQVGDCASLQPSAIAGTAVQAVLRSTSKVQRSTQSLPGSLACSACHNSASNPPQPVQHLLSACLCPSAALSWQQSPAAQRKPAAAASQRAGRAVGRGEAPRDDSVLQQIAGAFQKAAGAAQVGFPLPVPAASCAPFCRGSLCQQMAAPLCGPSCLRQQIHALPCADASSALSHSLLRHCLHLQHPSSLSKHPLLSPRANPCLLMIASV